MSGDRERDDSKPRPTAPAGVLGGPGKRAEAAPVETVAKVPKSAFAHTVLGLQGAGAPAVVNEQAEPLRDPSDRPVPVPYKRTHGAWGGTLPMPEAGDPGNQSRERMIAAKPGSRQDSSSVEVRPATVVGTPESREPTMRMPTTANSAAAVSARPPSSRALPAAPPPSGGPPAMPQSAAARSPSPKPPAPSPRAPEAKRDDPSVPRLSLGVERIPSQEPATKVEFSGQSQPLQLSLDARDHVESSLRPESAVPQRSMMPWVALAVVVVLGGLAFMFMGGDEPAAPVTAERVEAVPAAESPTPQPATPPATTPTTEGAAQAVAPVAPAAPAVAPKPAAPEPSAAAATKQEVKEPAKPVAKRKARRTKKPAASPTGPVLKVTPQDEGDDLEAAARAAERFAEPEGEIEPPEPPAAEPPAPDEE